MIVNQVLQKNIYRSVITVLVLGIVVFAGLLFLKASRAATPYISAEAENGNLKSGAARVTDATTSNGVAVRFASPSNSQSFVHPGILVNGAQLDFVKAKIAAGEQPWKNELAKAISAKGTSQDAALSSANYIAHPWVMTGCGAYHNPNEGCFDETSDAEAAYTNALLWYYTGNATYAQQSIAIMNAWSKIMKGHKTDGVYLADSSLQAAWAGSVWPRAAEIIRYTYTPQAGNETFDTAQFASMLRTAYLPQTIDGWKGAGFNRITTQAEATIVMGVYLDDRAVFENGLSDWRDNVKCNIWMNGDTNKWPNQANLPINCTGSVYDNQTTTYATAAALWNNPKLWPDGLDGETCRDYNHMMMGLSSVFNAAETARIQGVDLYGEQQARLLAALELNNGYINSYDSGASTPLNWPCSTPANGTNGVQHITGAVAYTEYAMRRKVTLPQTNFLIQNKILPSNYRVSVHVVNEFLSSYGTP